MPDDPTLALPVAGRLCAYWEQGMEGAVDAMLDPSPLDGPPATSPSALLRLREGDVLAVRSPEGREIWRGVLRVSGWPFGTRRLPADLERWFSLGYPATLLARDDLPFWQRAPGRPFLVPARRVP